jgi:hypothetical protein
MKAVEAIIKKYVHGEIEELQLHFDKSRNNGKWYQVIGYRPPIIIDNKSNLILPDVFILADGVEVNVRNPFISLIGAEKRNGQVQAKREIVVYEAKGSYD